MKVKTKIKPSSLVQIILLIFLILWHDSGIVFYLGKQTFCILSLIICCFTFFKYRQTRKNYPIIFIFFILLNIVFVRLISGGVGIQMIIYWSSAIFLATCSYYINPEKFIDRFVKLTIIFSVASLGMWILAIISPSFCEKISFFTYVPFSNKIYYDGISYFLSPVTYSGSFFYVLRDGTDILRNNGIFNEPGLYQIVLNSALYFSVFYPENIFSSKRKKKLILIILVLTILSTQSTTGYIGMVITLFGHSLLSKKRFRYYLLAAVVVLLLVIDYSINLDSSLFMTTVGMKISFSNGQIEFGTSGLARVETISIVLTHLMTTPFGIGYENIDTVWKSYSKTSADGVALFSTLLALGIQIWAIIVAFVFYPMYKYKKNTCALVVALLLYINTTLGQSDIFYPALLILSLPIISYKIKSNEIDHIK